MNKKNILLILTGILLLVFGFYFFIADGTEPVTVAEVQPEPQLMPRQITLPPVERSYPEYQVETKDHEIESETEALVEHPMDIEEIKKQIYDLEVEYVEDIALLDSVVQTGDEPTQDFWLGGWVSVDDWKEEVNGFNLVPQRDGTFIFYPDEATTRTYTFFETPRTYMYDPERKEFYWEMDYYGKTISHIARFINENVLATMLISGDKVTMDIYRKKPAEGE
ncbi:MAG: hypothetical protein JXM72_02275 [Deltaproteobacteria bacterium]|nr:hypothetical protein [Deltaproteobacteria bacterium]